MSARQVARPYIFRAAFHRRRWLVPMSGLLFTLCLLLQPATAQEAFYKATAEQSTGRPGTLIRHEPLANPPSGTLAYRILYRSIGLNGEPIAVSGFVVIPASGGSQADRPIVAWAHPTTGVASNCAPSLRAGPFEAIPGLSDMVQRGYVVTATDYPGLGTSTVHPYLIGESEGRAVLDSVRAAAGLTGAHPSRRFVVWGHSQGGQAAIYAGILARSYAPELKLAGVAAAAPATDLVTLLRDDFATRGGKSITAMALWSWARVFSAPIEGVVVPGAMATVDRLAEECTGSVFGVLEHLVSERPLQQTFLTIPDITVVEPWRSLIERNSAAPLPEDIPAFLAQGTTDQVVRPSVTQAYMSALCRNGTAVKMLVIPEVGHAFIAHRSASQAMDWMADRLTGKPAPSDCRS
ncbi:MAG: alpha/beta fold hydrolase [Mesorhizobium sp.]|nr:MAG: alpha/beta fold hydrolase [Mesorhizobium sp.]TIO21883.1 MAG: alpha/beta fold hydrolase [Mesorhizobium sp.]TJV55647.1 MAG: alpha/beta fold hydrolase [Mesorhizobium sp.]